MSDRRIRLYHIKMAFDPGSYRWAIRASSEEEAVERFKEEYAHDIFHNWIKYSAEVDEDYEE